MARPQLDVPFVPGSQEEIRDLVLSDMRLEAQRLNIGEVAVHPGTDNYRFAMAMSGVSMLQFSNIDLAKAGVTPKNATGQDLEDWRESLGLPVVEPSPSTGKIVLTVSGTSSVSDGEPLVLPNGFRAVVVGNWIGVIDKDEIDVKSVDTGEDANLDGGTEIRFVNPPTNVSERCMVSKSFPLRGGTDEESEERKRTRVINAIANKPGGGNWAQLRQICLETLGNVKDAGIYPALGGPSSVKVVPYRDMDPDESEFTRELSSAAISVLRDAIFAKTCDGVELVVQATQDQDADVALYVTIPQSTLSGGNGQGWVDQSPWPPANVLPSDAPVRVLGVSSSRDVFVGADTAQPPVPGQTHVAWWSPVDRKFVVALVTQILGGGPGSWILSLDRPLSSDDGTIVAIGDYICPASVNAEAYGESWVNAMRALGPGENTEDPGRLPRALRHPYVVDENPSALSFLTLEAFRKEHGEISDISYAYKPTSQPTVPATVSDPPNILVPRHFAIYPA